MSDPKDVSGQANPTGALPVLLEVCQIILQSKEWKKSLAQALPYIRRLVIFDNFALYQKLPQENTSFEVVYARAMGRGKSAGEYISWGDATAAHVFDTGQFQVNQPPLTDVLDDNRLDFPCILGIPIQFEDQFFSLILVRFGAPDYSQNDKQTAMLISSMVGILLRQKVLQDRLSQLENERQQAVLQEDFISTISHELTSPIGFIKGYTTTLMRSDTTWTPDNQKEFLTIIDEETDRMEELIENLLDSSRLQSGSFAMDMQPVQLDTLIRDVTMRAKAHQINLEINFKMGDSLPRILGDSRRLTQVFENLISNAIKYAPGSHLTIIGEVLNEQIHLIFSDDGPGISVQHLPNLFKKFYRSPENPTETRGTGLGLYICRQIITAHNGEIFAESEPGKGVTIHILLPIAAHPSGREGKS
jgi:signal transduction histidine kinase